MYIIKIIIIYLEEILIIVILLHLLYGHISFVHGNFIGISNEKQIIKDRLLLTSYAPMDGLNQVGLAISVLLLPNKSTHQNNPNLINITTSIMIRGVLDYCKNIKEAILFFKKFNMHDALEGNSFHFMITDANGDSVVIEYINNKIELVYPDKNKNLKYLFVTNFYLSTEDKSGFGFDRYKILEDYLNKTDVRMEWNDAIKLLEKVQMGITI